MTVCKIDRVYSLPTSGQFIAVFWNKKEFHSKTYQWRVDGKLYVNDYITDKWSIVSSKEIDATYYVIEKQFKPLSYEKFFEYLPVKDVELYSIDGVRWNFVMEKGIFTRHEDGVEVGFNQMLDKGIGFFE